MRNSWRCTAARRVRRSTSTFTMLPSMPSRIITAMAPLHEEPRRLGVDGHHPVEEFRGRVEDRVPVGDAGAVDQNVDPAEVVVGRSDDAGRGSRVGEVSFDEDCSRSAFLDRSGDRIPTFGVAPGDDDASGAAVSELSGDSGAEALGRAGDNRDLAVEISLHVILLDELTGMSMRPPGWYPFSPKETRDLIGTTGFRSSTPIQDARSPARPSRHKEQVARNKAATHPHRVVWEGGVGGW